MFEWIGVKIDMGFRWLFHSWYGGYICGVVVTTVLYWVFLED